MWLKIVGVGLLAVVLAALELTGVPGGISGANLVVAAIIFLVYYDYFLESIVFAGMSGLLADFFSAGRFGFFLAVFVFLALALNFLMYNFFSTKNWVTLLVFSFSGLVIYGLAAVIAGAVASLSFGAAYVWQNIADKTVELIFTFALIVGINFIFRRWPIMKNIRQ